jgi:hypothetical protein
VRAVNVSASLAVLAIFVGRVWAYKKKNNALMGLLALFRGCRTIGKFIYEQNRYVRFFNFFNFLVILIYVRFSNFFNFFVILIDVIFFNFFNFFFLIGLKNKVYFHR